MLLGHLHPKPPYSLTLSARLMNRYHGVLDVFESGAYFRALKTAEGVIALVQVTPLSDALDSDLRVDLLAGKTTYPDMLLSTVARIVGANEDFAPFYALAKTDSHLSQVVDSLAGLHHFQSETVFEALMQIIIEQQISLYAALAAQRRLVEWGGDNITHNETIYYTFPSPQTITAASPDELHGLLKITHRRVALMQQVATAVVDGQLNLEILRGLPAEEIYQQLNAIKGIGHWTAAWTLIRGLSQFDYAGHNDVALRDAVAHYFYGQEERISAEETAATFEKFIPYAGLAAFYTLMRWAVERY